MESKIGKEQPNIWYDEVFKTSSSYHKPWNQCKIKFLSKQWIHKGDERIRIKKEEMGKYISEGWICGSGVNNKGRCVGSKFINDGNMTRRINSNNINDYIGRGWKLGKLNRIK